jgi:predicted regulator of Ras-like GTPase activity (Roadblock/LC7/MglB family)
MVTATHLQYSALANILKDLVSQGGFTIAVLTDSNGLPLASSDVDQETSEAQSAVVAQVQNVVLRALGHLSMSAPEEISLNDVDGRKLVCRQFSSGETMVYLAVLIPNRVKSYRLLMNRAIRSVQNIWDL